MTIILDAEMDNHLCQYLSGSSLLCFVKSHKKPLNILSIVDGLIQYGSSFHSKYHNSFRKYIIIVAL